MITQGNPVSFGPTPSMNNPLSWRPGAGAAVSRTKTLRVPVKPMDTHSVEVEAGCSRCPSEKQHAVLPIYPGTHPVCGGLELELQYSARTKMLLAPIGPGTLTRTTSKRVVRDVRLGSSMLPSPSPGDYKRQEVRYPARIRLSSPLHYPPVQQTHTEYIQSTFSKALSRKRTL